MGLERRKIHKLMKFDAISSSVEAVQTIHSLSTISSEKICELFVKLMRSIDPELNGKSTVHFNSLSADQHFYDAAKPSEDSF